ncbi:response regulator [bacterium]|nr:response regulator [bacterium]
MNALIIDDERLAREELKRLLQPHSEIQIIDEARNADEALMKIRLHHPDLLFLDIQMPGQNGFDLLSQLDDLPHVIFTTAYDHFAIRAFEVNALDYLLKPIDPKRLEEALRKLPEEQSQSTGLLSEEDKVFVREDERCWFVKLKTIRLMESEGNYTRLYFDDFKPLILRSLNQLEQRIDPKVFFRASRQHIINLQWIEKIDPWFDSGLLVHLKGGFEIKMSRRQAQKFKETMSF